MTESIYELWRGIRSDDTSENAAKRSLLPNKDIRIFSQNAYRHDGQHSFGRPVWHLFPSANAILALDRQHVYEFT